MLARCSKKFKQLKYLNRFEYVNICNVLSFSYAIWVVEKGENNNKVSKEFEWIRLREGCGREWESRRILRTSSPGYWEIYAFHIYKNSYQWMPYLVGSPTPMETTVTHLCACAGIIHTH